MSCSLFPVPYRSPDVTKNLAAHARLGGGADGGNSKGAGLIGETIAERLKAQGITRVVFDRNGFLYHGRVKEVAEADRKAGLEF